MPNKSSSTIPSSPSNVTPDVISKIVKAERRDFDLIKRNKWWLILVSILLIIFIIWRCPILNFVYRVTGINLSRDCKTTFSLKDLFNDLSRGGGPNNLMVSNGDGSYSSVTVDTDGNVITNNLPTPAFTSGPTGIPGTDGIDGSNGVGIVGPAGPAGATGASGSNGSNGTNGTNGSAGATGPIGPAGPPGLPAPVPGAPCVGGEYLVWNGVAFVCTLTTNTLVNDGINTMTSTVNGVADSDVIINTNTLTIGGGNLTSTVNGVGGSVALTTLFSNNDGGDLTNPGGELTITGGVGAVLGAGTTVGLTPCGAGQAYVYTAGVWTCTSAVINAQNGTSLVGNAVELGLNPLLHDTTVPQAGFDMTFTGGNFYHNVIGTTSGIEHGIQSASDILGFVGVDGTIMYSSSAPAGIPGGGEGSYVMTLPGSAGSYVSDGAGANANMVVNPGSFQLFSNDATSDNVNIWGGSGVMTSSAFDGATGAFTTQALNNTPGEYYLYTQSGVGAEFGSLDINSALGTTSLYQQDSLAAIARMDYNLGAGTTSFYNQDNLGSFANLIIDVDDGLIYNSAVALSSAPNKFQVNTFGDVIFDRALMPGNDAGLVNDLLISQGVGVAPVWTDPATFLAANTTNTLTWTQVGGITSTVNGVIANVPLAAGTLTTVLGYDALGNPANESLATFQCDPTGTFFCQEGNTFGTRGMLGTNDAFDQAFETAGVERLRITQTGRLLVSNTNGGVGSENVFLGNNVGNETLGGGGTNIGIGQDVLNVLTTGTLNIAIGSYALDEATSGTNNIAIADSALTSLTTGGENIAIGHNALNGVTSGEFNIGIGPNALSGVVTSNNNTALGYDAGAGSSGNDNVFVGYRTGNAFSTGSNNILIGYDIDAPIAGNNNQLTIGNIIYGTDVDGTNTSLSTGGIGIGQPSPLARFHVGAGSLAANTAGTLNFAIGFNSMLSNTLGNNNTAIGHFALDSNTLGGQNLAIGQAALGANVSGDFNLAIGDLALGANTASNNIAIGYQSLGNNSSGFHNIAVGRTALADNTTGNYNIAIGFQALNDNIAAHQNLAIGYTALSANTTGTRNLGLGYSALGLNMTGNDNLAIGASALDVNLASYNIAIGSNTLGENTVGDSNVAIGPNALLGVPASTTSSFNIAIGRDASRLNTTGDSNIAIGTNALYDNGSGNWNVAIGENALQNTTTNGSVAVGYSALSTTVGSFYNSAVGYLALRDTTVGNNSAFGAQALMSNSTGQYNSAMGAFSLDTNTTGSENTAMGYNSLTANIDGVGNSSFGYETMRSNSDGGYNVAVGFRPLYNNISGNLNIGIGYGALYANSVGNENTAIGANALYDNTGSFNAAFGSSALTNNVGGQYNTAVGNRSAFMNISGDENVALGYQALWGNDSGDRNVALGTGALYMAGLTPTAANNIAIGYQAGNNIASGGNNNIIIGYDIDAPVAAGANQLSLGNLIFGTGIDGTGTTISTGNIGIANSSPAYRLHVGSAAIVSGTTVARFENAGGTCDVTPNVAGGITCTSDLNSKRNISDFSGGLDLLASLQPKSFNMKADTEGSATQLGFIAQDVEQVIPGLVMTDANGKKSLSYIGLVPYTISAIKEQQIQFNSLSLDVEGLKADVTTLADNTGINLTNIEHQASSIEPKDSGLLGLISEAITNFFNSVSVAFNKTATFLSGAVFKGRVEFEDKDLAGYAVISAGASSVRVNYSTAYAQAPVVNVTAKQLSRNFAVTDESETGFTISLANTLDENSRFSWSAIAVKDAKTFNSDVSIVNDEPILTETPSKEAVQVPISSPTSTPSKESITPTESTPTVTVAPVTSEVINEPTPSETITTSSPGIE